MATLLSVDARDFRAFPKIHWNPPQRGLHLLDARDLSTGRCNMCGKTTLLDAAFWSAYGWLPKWGGPKGGTADAVIRRGTKSCFVTTRWRCGQDTLTIKRKRPTSLEVLVNEKPVEGKDPQRVIEEHLGTAARYLRTVYLTQDRNEEANTKSFFTMSDVERTELLSVVAGLEKLDKALAQAKAERDALDKDLTALGGKLEAQRARLAELPAVEERRRAQLQAATDDLEGSTAALAETREKVEAQIAELEKSVAERTKAATEAQAKALAEITPELEKAAARYRQLEAELDDSPKPEPEYFDALATARDNLAAAQKHNRDREKALKDNAKINDKLERLAQEALDAETGKCGQCSQELPQWSREAAVKEKLSKYELAAQGLVEVPEPMPEDERAYHDAQAALAQRKAELEAQPAKIRAELAAQKSRINELTAKANAAKQQASSERGKLLVELESFKKQSLLLLQGAEALAKNAADRESKALEELADALEEAARCAQTVADTQAQIADKTAQRDLALDLVELFGPRGYRSVCFDGLIERIGARAGQLLSIMTDGIYSTSLRQLGVDGKGNSKMVLRPVITKGGQHVPDDDPSGGGRKHAMLAYDVSVSDAAGEGAPLFLDEALDGLDTIGKQEAMAMLEEVARTRPVIVIDHSSEAKAAFTSVITIEHNDGISRLCSELTSQDTGMDVSQ